MSYFGFPCHFPLNSAICPARAPAQVRTTQAPATERAVALRKSMYSRPSTTNRVLAASSHNRRSSRHSHTTICILMTPPKIGRCTILASPGPTITGTRFISTHCLILMIYLRAIFAGDPLCELHTHLSDGFSPYA